VTFKTLTTAGLALALCACLGARSPGRPATDRPPPHAEEEVRATELAFARSMAERSFADFVSHLSKDAVFFDEGSVLHGADAVAVAWKPLFAAPAAPFSWSPDHVEVLPSADLALSTGPVVVNGKVVGRFNSIWRLEAPHVWRIVFDKGESSCAVPSK
jgi:ketosteroid isomerase-like protein